MARIDQLTPPEQFLMLDPQNASPSELIKIGLLSLAAMGIIKVTDGPAKGLFSRKPTSLFNVVPGRMLDAPPSLAPLVEVVSRAAGGSTDVVAKEARRAFGDQLRSYRTRLQEGLERRGLLTKIIKPRMLVFTTETYEPTAAGMMARDRIRKAIEGTWRIPNLLHNDPVEAAALILAAGSSILIVQELRQHYGRMGEITRKHTSDGGDSGSWDFSTSNNSAGSWSFADFDAGSFSSFDSSMSGFDSSFDSSFSDSGSGGDSGGADGGGGGGD